ncbi:hypothetical protein [Labrys sp. WJW]|nr:hypothetical protein [Labrys sp. WJW]
MHSPPTKGQTMCFSAPKPPPLPPPPPVPNRQDDANQAAVQTALRRVRNQNGAAQTQLTGGLGDPNYGQNVNVQQLGRTQ